MNEASKIQFVYFGTPAWAATTLSDLIEKYNLRPSLVVTNPDRRAGRGLTLTPSPVKQVAEKHSIPVLTPERLGDIRKDLEEAEWDVFIVVAYGKIFPEWLLSIPRSGALNLHFSLLPKYRGASPVESQLLAGERKTGLSIIKLDQAMDHGPVAAEWSTLMPSPLPSRDELGTLLAHEGARVIAENLHHYLRSELVLQEQDHARATYTKKFAKTDADLTALETQSERWQRFQALRGILKPYFMIEKDGQSLRVVVSAAEFVNEIFTPLRVIPENKKEMSWGDYTKTYPTPW